MLQQAPDEVRNPEPRNSARASGINFSKFSLMHGSGDRERTGELVFSSSACILPLSYSWLKVIIIRRLDQNGSISRVVNIVPKAPMGVGDEAVDVLCFWNC